MLFAIRAYEDGYGGLHGICYNEIIEEKTRKEAELYALERARELIEDYQFLLEEFEQQALDEGLEPDTEEFQDYVYNCITENIVYEVYEVKRTKGKTLEELEEEFTEDREAFVFEYC